MKKRRARNDPLNRDFKCPCGKSYLSYPALFTHVKQKHNGKVALYGMFRRPVPLSNPRIRTSRGAGLAVILWYASH